MLARSLDRNSVRPSICPPVRPSDRPSVTHVLCNETIEYTAEICKPHERVINLVIWYQQRLVGDVPFHLKFALKVTHPPLKNAEFDQYLLIAFQPYELAKSLARTVETL